MDLAWWKQCWQEVAYTTKAQRVSVNPMVGNLGVTMISASQYPVYGNSGAGAISLAARGGAKRIILLGYDCQHTGGKRHWHEDHPRHMGNADTKALRLWGANFEKLAKDYAHAQIINCSRQTALQCFERQKLEDVL